HRDLKPANIFVTVDGEPKIGDLGVAHLLTEDTRLTQTGTVIGTPLYMAPEQVEGRPADVSPRTDVYALGVILYRLLAGEVPHTGRTAVEVYEKILHREPARPRSVARGVSRDLETICLKAMEKEPQRRYADGSELADDLARYLERKPIAARAPTLSYRAWKRVRRNWAVWTLGAAVVLLGLAGLAAAWLALGRTDLETEVRGMILGAERAYEAGDYEKTRLMASEALRLWPGHEEARYWLTRLKIRRYQLMRGVPEARVVRGLVEVIPPRPETPQEKGLRAEIERDLVGLEDRPLANGILALWSGWHDDALREFGKVPPQAAGAWEAELYSGTAHYLNGDFEKALPLLTRHRGRDPEATVAVWIRATLAVAQARDREGKDSEDLYLQAIAACADLAGDSGRILEAQALVAWARMMEMYGKDPEEKYAEAVGRVEGLEGPEARVALGDALFARAEYRQAGGRVDPANPVEYEEAIRAYGEPVTGPGFLRRAEARLAQFLFQGGYNLGSRENLKLARKDFEDALKLNPEYADAEIGLLQAVTEIEGWDVWDDPEKTEAIFRKWVAGLAKVVEDHPRYAPAYRGRGRAYKSIGILKYRTGKDPTPEYGAAIEDFGRAISVNPKDLEAYRRRGVALQDLATYRAVVGQDPTGEYRRAIEDMSRAIERNPRDGVAYRKRGLIRQNLALFLARRGEGSVEAYEAAIGDFSRAVEINPRDGEAYQNRGLARQNLAMFRHARGGDPVADLRAAIGDLDRAIELSARNREAYRYRALARQNLAQFEEDPTGSYEAAIRDFGRAIAI
ncbi:MAG: protein kinase domain-containing protein, partial [Planctomycetota bacterium]